MIWDTAAIEPCTARLRVWMYCIHPKTIPPAHTTSPAMRIAVPLTAPLRNVIAFRSGIRMSASLAIRTGETDAANAAAPHLKDLWRFIESGEKRVGKRVARAAKGFGK